MAMVLGAAICLHCLSLFLAGSSPAFQVLARTVLFSCFLAIIWLLKVVSLDDFRWIRQQMRKLMPLDDL
jgi:Zn-dependent protease